ncbi:hypothetical protein ACOMHN_056660 [Nucella lapillus]
MPDTAPSGLLLLAVACLVWSCTAATRLRCFVGEEICSRWQNDDAAEHGLFNGKVVCCPPENHQALLLNSFLPDPDSCQCEVGTAEKYAHVGTSGSVGSGCPPVTMVVVGMSVLVVWLFGFE